MSIIVLHHTVADNFEVDPNYDVSSSGRLSAGSLVALNASGYVEAAGKTNALGIAGDSLSDEYKTTAYSDELVISPTGAKRWTQNRIDNYFNETLASGKMTVYTTGGLFGTDQYVASDTFVPGAMVYSDAEGQVTTDSSGGARSVGFVRTVPGEYPSGVPGVDAPSVQNSISLGSYLFVQLSI